MKDTKSHQLKILVCEADTRVLTRLSSWVMAMGEEVFSSDDAIVASQLFEEHNPDILLVSQNINNMGTIEFIDAIKHKKPSQAVILMLDNEASGTLFKRAIDLQVDKYLNAPVDASMLFSAVDALSDEKIWHEEFLLHKRTLQDYKDATDKSFSVSKHDSSGKIFYVNALFCETTGLSMDEAMQGNINPLQNPNEDMDAVWEELQTKKIYKNRQTFIFNEGNERIVDITAVALSDSSENIVEFLVFSNDVTEVILAARKIKEQEVDKKIQKLEHVRELNKVKDNFLTVFSHELKTPLNSIINFSEYIKKHLSKEDFPKRDRLLDQVALINMSGWQMLDMISNLIDAMKFRDAKIELQKSELSLNDTINEVLMKHNEALKGVKLIKSFKNECIINNEKKKVFQLIDNLISNAIKYSNASIAIVIKANDTSFVLEILDDGKGFEDVSKVFGLFEQSSEDSMTRTAEGTGVGLFVVQKLCDAMNYTITLGSSKNLGGARVIIQGKKE